MTGHRIFAMPFAAVYPAYVKKAERKGRTKEEVDRVICWLTGYDQAGLQHQLEKRTDFETFFAQAPAMHPNRSRIKGVVCGIRVEEIEDPLMKKIRQLDKLVDELAKGKAALHAEVAVAQSAIDREAAALAQQAATRLLGRPVRAIEPNRTVQ